MGFVENAFAGNGGGYWSIQSLGQRDEVSARLEGSEADVKQGPAAGFDPLEGLRDLFLLQC
jgi:hypothetical protein